MINGGCVSRGRIPLIGLEDVVGWTLAVVAPPLGAFARVTGPFARAGCVGGVVVRARSLVHTGQSHVTHQRRFCEKKITYYLKHESVFDRIIDHIISNAASFAEAVWYINLALLYIYSLLKSSGA